MFGDFSPRKSSSSKRRGLRLGFYTIQSLDKSCGTSYLSTDKKGKRIKLQSAAAENPRQWLVLLKPGSKAGRKAEYTLLPASGATSGGKLRKLSYSKDCTSSSARLSRKEMMSWTVRYKYRAGGKSSYTIRAASKPTKSKRFGKCPKLLGCSSSSKAGRRASPALLSGSSRLRAAWWKLRFVRALRPSSPASESTQVVAITVGVAGETVDSFGQAQQDALCATMVAASGNPAATCTITTVVLKGDGSGVDVGIEINVANPMIGGLPNPGPSKPVPAQPVPAQPVPAQPVPAQPVIAQPVPAQPVPVQPVPAQPVPAQPVPAQPVPAQPVLSQPVPAPPVVVAVVKPPTVAAAPGLSPNQVTVTGTEPTPANQGTTLKVACVPTMPGVQCPSASGPGITWTDATTAVAQQIGKIVDGSTDMVGGTSYTCYSAEFVGTQYACSTTPSVVTAALRAPTVSTATSTTAMKVMVTATAAGSNTGTALKVACVSTTGATCPGASVGIWTDATTAVAQQIGAFYAGTPTPANMVGGTSYTCYSAEFVGTNYRVCSTGVAAPAELTPPTVAAQTGSVGGAMSVTATAASNTYSTLKIGCVANGESCPAVEATAWIPVTTSGSPQQVSTLAGGSGTVANTAYTCYSAEFSTLKSYRVCSEKRDVTSKALNAPSVTAASGFVPNQVAVTGAAPAAGNVGTTLKVACVVQSGGCPDFGALGWVAVGTSGTAKQVAKLSDGAADLATDTRYTCWSAEFDATSRVCSTTGADASTPPQFYRAANGVTILCPTAAVEATGVVDGTTYTKRDRTGLEALRNEGSAASLLKLTTTCTSGVTDMTGMLKVRVSAPSLLPRCFLAVLCTPWMSRCSLDTAVCPRMSCRASLPSTRTSVPGIRAR